MSIDRQTFVRAGKISGVAGLVSAAALGLTLLGQASVEQSKVFTPFPPDQCPLGEQINLGLGDGVQPVEAVLGNSRGIRLCLTQAPINGTVFNGRGIFTQHDYRPYGTTLALPDPQNPTCIQNDAAKICSERKLKTDSDGKETVELTYKSANPVMENSQGNPAIFTVQHGVIGPDGKSKQIIGISSRPHNTQEAPLPTWALPLAATALAGASLGAIGLLRAKSASRKASNANAEAESSKRAAESARAQATRVIEDTKKLRGQAQNALREREGYLKQIREMDKQLNIKTDVGNAATTSNQALRDKINTLEAIIAENSSNKK